jgi:hypothetical protein
VIFRNQFYAEAEAEAEATYCGDNQLFDKTSSRRGSSTGKKIGRH